MSELVVLKLGGSVLSDRHRLCCFDPAPLSALVDVLAPWAGRLVVVHGTGTFGRAYLPLYDGAAIPRERAALGRRVQAAIRELHERIVDLFLAHDVPVRGVDPDAVLSVRGHRILRSSLDVVRDTVDAGAIPVMYGATVLALDGGYEIVSSERVLGHVAAELGAARAVWCTDVDGVFGADGAVLPEVSEAERDRVLRLRSDELDITGGMGAKLETSFALARAGVESCVVNARDPGAVARALAGERDAGTWVRAAAGVAS